jgi:hypothetical protein
MQQAVFVFQISVDHTVFMAVLDSCNELLEEVHRQWLALWVRLRPLKEGQAALRGIFKDAHKEVLGIENALETDNKWVVQARMHSAFALHILAESLQSRITLALKGQQDTLCPTCIKTHIPKDSPMSF